MIDRNKLSVGLQVAFIPSHVREECSNVLSKMLKHEDTRFGFVSSWKYKDNLFPTIFCRFWNKFHPTVLRTLSCSEGCDPIDLIKYDSRTQEVMDATLKILRDDPMRYGWTEQKEQHEEV